MRRQNDRGATLVEYALVIALFVTVSVGAVEMLTNNASDEYAASGERIGSPNPTLPPDWVPPPDRDPVPPDSTTTLPPATTTTAPATTTTVAPTTTTVAPTPVELASAGCTLSLNRCTFNASGPADGTFAWRVDGTARGTGPSLTYDFPALGDGQSRTYQVSVTVTPPGQTVTRSVRCTGTRFWGFPITSCEP